MSEAPAWIGYIKDIAGVVLPVGAYLLGKATKGGANQISLDAVCHDMKDVRRQVDLNTITLSNHQLLHDGYVPMDIQIQRDLKDTNRMLGLICGRLGVDLFGGGMK